MNDLPLCACGCGQAIIPKPHHRYHPSKYLPSHFQYTGPRAYTPKVEEIPTGFCECGCGQSTTIAKVTYRDKRHFRGHPIPYIRGHSPKKIGEKSHKWKGGRYIANGYVFVYAPDHPAADRDGHVREHRLVMERKLGRLLTKDEIPHHINHQRSDNREENLMLMTFGEHSALHGPGRVYGAEARKKMSVAGKKGAASRWGHKL